MYLFRKILDEQHTLPKTEQTKDLLQLINFVLRKFFKKVEDDPFVIVQALGPKTRGHWKELSSYKSDEDSDDDGMAGQRERIAERVSINCISGGRQADLQMARGPVDLLFKKNKNLSWSEQMGAVIAMLLQTEHRDWIEWIIEVLEVVLASRQEIVLSTDGEQALVPEDSDDEDEGVVRKFGGPSKEAIEKFQRHGQSKCQMRM